MALSVAVGEVSSQTVGLDDCAVKMGSSDNSSGAGNVATTHDAQDSSQAHKHLCLSPPQLINSHNKYNYNHFLKPIFGKLIITSTHTSEMQLEF